MSNEANAIKSLNPEMLVAVSPYGYHYHAPGCKMVHLGPVKWGNRQDFYLIVPLKFVQLIGNNSGRRYIPHYCLWEEAK